jgi:hypothetical protein
MAISCKATNHVDICIHVSDNNVLNLVGYFYKSRVWRGNIYKYISKYIDLPKTMFNKDRPTAKSLIKNSNFSIDFLKKLNKNF